MIDLLHLPEPDERTVWFPGQGASTDTIGWRIWTKPRGISMVAIYAIGSGGGGGGGAGNFSGAIASGGGGGAPGPIVSALFLASMLPDRLYVRCTSGGLGGNGGGSGLSGSSGASGTTSLVAIYPVIAAGNNVISTSSGGGNGIGGSTGSFSVSGGSTSTPTISSFPLAQMAAAYSIPPAGSGSTGRADSAGDSQAVTGLIQGGAGGGGKNTTGTGTAGGGIGVKTNSLIGTSIPGGTAETGAAASSGFIRAGIYFGGCGGGGNSIGVGGRGGNGVSWGAGGGGGGGGLTGGRGGDGGPGLVIIASW